MHESDPKSVLTARMRSELLRFVIFRHEDKATYSVPDWSITGLKDTSWWEGKLARKGQLPRNTHQELNMRRLANVGFSALYIVWDLDGTNSTTRIVSPQMLDNWYDIPFEKGFDHEYVIDKVREVHSNDHV